MMAGEGRYALFRPTHVIAAVAAALLTGAGPADDGRWHAGAYSYSDELGGFRITGVSGTGSRDDPVTIRQELHTPGPVTLVVRARERPTTIGRPGEAANGFIHMRIVTRNASGVGWIAFEFELQEAYGKASTFGDGLSFDQRRIESETITSPTFARNLRDFEPVDRLLFQGGAVDHGTYGEFGFLVTDFTPVRVFYLVQDPRIPFS